MYIVIKQGTMPTKKYASFIELLRITCCHVVDENRDGDYEVYFRPTIHEREIQEVYKAIKGIGNLLVTLKSN